MHSDFFSPLDLEQDAREGISSAIQKREIAFSQLGRRWSLLYTWQELEPNNQIGVPLGGMPLAVLPELSWSIERCQTR